MLEFHHGGNQSVRTAIHASGRSAMRKSGMAVRQLSRSAQFRSAEILFWCAVYMCSAFLLAYCIQTALMLLAKKYIPENSVPLFVASNLISSISGVLGLAILLKVAVRNSSKEVGGIKSNLSISKINHKILIVTIAALAAFISFVIAGQGFLISDGTLLSTQLLFLSRLVDWPLIIFFAPLAEELFFRGWLWNQFRKTNSELTTAAVTMFVWWTPHLLIDWRYFWLLPVAILLTFSRIFGKTVIASLLVHVAYNAIVVFYPLWLLIVIHEAPIAEGFSLLRPNG